MTIFFSYKRRSAIFMELFNIKEINNKKVWFKYNSKILYYDEYYQILIILIWDKKVNENAEGYYTF